MNPLTKYKEDVEFLKSMDMNYLTRRLTQLQAIILRSTQERDLIWNELHDRKTKVTDGISKENQS